MCGIIGCVNDEAVAPILLQGLKRVEYRGYDSAGVATISESVIRVRKGAGRIDDIERKYGLSTLTGTTGIAHTRWATHGGVTDQNAHPHTSCREMVAIVHNGIIENNLEVVKVTNRSVEIFDMNGRPVRRKPTQVAWELADLSKMDYAHYTLKEIHEQPKTVVSAMMQNEEKLAEFAEKIRGARSVFVTAAGTSYHAGLLLKYRLERDAVIRCEVTLAGEFREHSDFVDGGAVVIALSQSGETADLLEAIREAKQKGAKVLSLVNTARSTLARESDLTLLLNCGPEVGVAATKSFTAQVVVANLIVDNLVGSRNGGGEEVAGMVEEALSSEPTVKEIARMYRERSDFYFIGRGYHYPMALDGALKLKELSYIHADGIAASELQHGTLALIEDGTPVVVINPRGETHADTLSNAEELKARGARVIGISDEPSDVYTHFVKIPRAKESLTPVLEAIPLQLMAYWTAVEKSNDPDYPRNLAKSVTVKCG